jgi:hypothetical protein
MALRQREQASWNTFSKSIEGNRLLFHRVENLHGNGMPDVVCINNYGASIWIENKDVEFWPKRPDTVVLKNRFEPGQLAWARAWNWRGGKSLVLARIEMEYYLLDPTMKIEEMNRAGLNVHALAIGKQSAIDYLYKIGMEKQ